MMVDADAVPGFGEERVDGVSYGTQANTTPGLYLVGTHARGSPQLLPSFFSRLVAAIHRIVRWDVRKQVGLLEAKSGWSSIW